MRRRDRIERNLAALAMAIAERGGSGADEALAAIAAMRRDVAALPEGFGADTVPACLCPEWADGVAPAPAGQPCPRCGYVVQPA